MNEPNTRTRFAQITAVVFAIGATAYLAFSAQERAASSTTLLDGSGAVSNPGSDAFLFSSKSAVMYSEDVLELDGDGSQDLSSDVFLHSSKMIAPTSLLPLVSDDPR